MILSYHPCFEADMNRLCAGRQPDRYDLNAIQTASAVILPQGCNDALYKMVRFNCKFVFPNWDTRFDYPGKTGQIRLFREIGRKISVAYPQSYLFKDMRSYNLRKGKLAFQEIEPYPFVFKLNYGGEGHAVFLIRSDADFKEKIRLAIKQEKNGRPGFLIQRYIPSRSRSLRVCVIGRRYVAYWRIQKNKKQFGTSLAQGATIDAVADPQLQNAGIKAAQAFCRLTGINLAGFDFIFAAQEENPQPLFLEINYFFGRKGLGGSQAFYAILEEEIQAWITGLPAEAYEHWE
jgi:ribosomal protein S6--L-glutamate ligase